MKKIILFIIMGINLISAEIKDNIGIFNANSLEDFTNKIQKIEDKKNMNFIFEYDFSKKIINLKDNKRTVLLEIIKSDKQKISLNIYISNDLNISKETLDNIIDNQSQLIENGKYKEYSYIIAEKIAETQTKNIEFQYIIIIISFIFLCFSVKYIHKGFRANRFK